jgi:hypothetical protein
MLTGQLVLFQGINLFKPKSLTFADRTGQHLLKYNTDNQLKISLENQWVTSQFTPAHFFLQ